MLQQFRTYRNPPSLCNDSWEFRKICKMGSVMPNATAMGDIDGDGVEEVLLGNSEGHLVILKSGVREPLFFRDLNGTISVVLWNAATRVLLVVCMEGKAALVQNCLPPFDNILVTHMIVPANCTTGVLSGNSQLILGSSDRRLYAYDYLLKQQVGYCFLSSQIFSVDMFRLCGRPIVAVGTTQEVQLIDATNPSAWEKEGIDTTLWRWVIDRSPWQTDAEGIRLPTAVAVEEVDHVATLVVASEDGCVWMFRMFPRSNDTVETHTKVQSFQLDGEVITIHKLWAVQLEALIPRILCVRSPSGMRAVCITVSGQLFVVDGLRNALVSKTRPEMCSMAFPLIPATKPHASSPLIVYCVSIDEVTEFEVPWMTLGTPGWISDTRHMQKYHRLRSVTSSHALVNANAAAMVVGGGDTTTQHKPSQDGGAGLLKPSASRGLLATAASVATLDDEGEEIATDLYDNDTILQLGAVLFPEIDGSLEKNHADIRRKVLRLCTQGYRQEVWDHLASVIQQKELNQFGIVAHAE